MVGVAMCIYILYKRLFLKKHEQSTEKDVKTIEKVLKKE